MQAVVTNSTGTGAARRPASASAPTTSRAYPSASRPMVTRGAIEAPTTIIGTTATAMQASLVFASCPGPMRTPHGNRHFRVVASTPRWTHDYSRGGSPGVPYAELRRPKSLLPRDDGRPPAGDDRHSRVRRSPMTPPSSLAPHATSRAAARLAARFEGDVFLSGDDGYEAGRRSWHRTID